jgi:hypothetical protein
VGGLGYCGLDKHRQPLTGEEQRSCWTGPDAGPADGVFAALIESNEAGLIDVKPPHGVVRPVTGR